jgi:hypothetical protein
MTGSTLYEPPSFEWLDGHEVAVWNDSSRTWARWQSSRPVKLALDVLGSEQLAGSTDPILRHFRVIGTPHIGVVTEDGHVIPTVEAPFTSGIGTSATYHAASGMCEDIPGADIMVRRMATTIYGHTPWSALCSSGFTKKRSGVTFSESRCCRTPSH